ncbi:TolC family protein [Sphingobacterium wenxiniae]|uniref:Outer membrane protein n=1 Tax=Sphingobacterium wenxiniae TaxID=683125 RepID=A0A1I6SYY3_9SPHI|nr:TolC family protein [Sphingobacterium wenxiniae]SFS82088.1 outer membrane protein [Sphingobacterium wenxiniae]
MVRKITFHLFSVLTLLGFCTIAYGQEISLEEAIQLTLNRNLQIKQARFGYQVSEQNLYEAKSALYPNLSVGASNTYNYGLAFDQISGQLIRGNKWTNYAGAQLSSSVAIFQGFQKVNQIKANKVQLLIDATEVEKVENDLTLSVITNYLEAITNGELYEAAAQQVQLSKEQLRQDSIQFEVGNKTLADLAQSENQVATDELNIMSSQNAYDLSLLELKQLMEMSPDTVITLIKPDIESIMAEYADVSYENTFQKALSTQPIIEQAGYNRQLAEKQIDIAKGAYYPTVTLSGSYGTNYTSEGRDIITQQKMSLGEQLDQNKSFRGGISLDFPIFDNNRRKVALSKAKINYLQAENNEALAKRNLEKTIAQAIVDLKFANRQYLASQVAFHTAQVAFDALKERYDVGVANSIELFTAQTNRNRAEFEMIRRKYELVFRGKVIDYYIGNPITF